MSLRSDRIWATVVLPVCLTVLSLISLTGCAGISNIGVPTGADANNTGTVPMFHGVSHGGSFAIAGAAIDLYMAGSTGYASVNANGVPNYVAATTTDGAGQFSLGLDLASNNDGTTNTFHCPTDGSDPQLYLVSRGGDSSGSGQTGINNTASVMVAAIGDCNGVSSHAYITINEATTVAAVWAMQQFMAVTSSDVLIGTPSGKTAALATAYGTVLMLVDPVHGVPNTVNTQVSSGSGVTMTATPESAKVIALANLLANCVNQSSASASPCTTLLNNAVSPSYATNAQPVVTGAQAAVDTAQAAYYLAINPSQGQDSGSGGASVAQGNSRMAALYTATSGYTPFGPSGLMAQPVSWTITVAYNAGSSTCAGAGIAGTAPFDSPAQLAIDPNGHLWVTNNGFGSSNAVIEMTAAGQVQGCFGATGNTAFAAGGAVVADPYFNVWYTVEGSSPGLYEIKGGAGTPISWTLPSTGGVFLPNSLAMTKAGDLIVVGDGSGAPPYIYPLASTARPQPTPAAMSTTNLEYNPGQIALAYTADDSAYSLASAAFFFTAYPPTTSGGYLLGSPSIVSNSQSNSAGAEQEPWNRVAGDTLKRFASTNPTGNAPVASTWFEWDPNSGSTTDAVNSPPYLGGMGSAAGFAVDGLGNYWTGSYGTVAAGTLAFFEVKNDVATALSPTGSSPTGCTDASCPTGGGFQFPQAAAGTGMYDIAIDGSGNVWGTVTGGSTAASNGLVELVGAAAPVVTPVSANLP